MKHIEKTSKRYAVTAILMAIPAVLLFAMGCESNDEQGDKDVAGGEAVAPEATPAAGAATDARRKGKGDHHGRKGHHKGHRDPAGMLLRTALKELDLTAEQRAKLEGLRDGKRGAKGQGHGPADFHQSLIKALETGTLDRAALEAEMKAKQKLAEEQTEQRNERLATLHATLTPQQRQTLVASVRARLEAKAAKHADKPDGDRKGCKDKRGFLGRGDHGCKMIAKLTRGLDLTDEQQAQIDSLTAKAEASRPSGEDRTDKWADKLAQIGALLDAFAADSFDPAASAPASKPMKDPAAKIALHADQIEALIGILTAEQRAQLAERIKSHPGKYGHGKKGHGMMGHGMKGHGMKGPDCPFGRDLDDKDL